MPREPSPPRRIPRRIPGRLRSHTPLADPDALLRTLDGDDLA